MHPFHPEYDPNIIAKNAADHKPEEKVNVSNSHFQSNARETNTKGFTYVCGECAVWFNVRSIQCQLHKHPLAFFNIIFNQLSCGICHRSLHTPFFRCEKCNFNLHVSCVPILPQIVKVACHRHNLSLTKSPVKERPEDDENSEFYCDVCEQSRELSDPTYKCEECKFVAHVHCAVTKELRVLVEEWSLPFKLENTKSDMSSSVHEGIGDEAEPVSSSSKSGFLGAPTDNEITARGVSLVAECKAKGARVAGDHASLIDLDAEIADHLGKMTCLETKFKAFLNRKNELQRRLEEFKERRDSSEFWHLLGE
ncbi:Diacylglycerol kinase [Actinidia chinensis var. chinensis]|uniref:Diacylglycerol kinase n=1 Tax=Actinidia chinensis var. chinensis TaxID=1590841 RepID=A0A2R6QIF8_ACTCC|nr:Diacylglycerol kinase [Actinidia chinensis var. chinensis]